jgi:hypothetical protein
LQTLAHFIHTLPTSFHLTTHTHAPLSLPLGVFLRRRRLAGVRLGNDQLAAHRDVAHVHDGVPLDQVRDRHVVLLAQPRQVVLRAIRIPVQPSVVCGEEGRIRNTRRRIVGSKAQDK